MSLIGNLDDANPTVLWGWAFDPEAPDTPVELELLLDDVPATRFAADQFRADLEHLGRAGHCSFVLQLRLPLGALARHTLRIRRVSDGAELPGSPRTIGADGLPPHEQMEQLGAELDRTAATTPAAIEQAVALLTAQARRLMQARAAAGHPIPDTGVFTPPPPVAAETAPRIRRALVIVDAGRQTGFDLQALARVRSLHRLVDQVVIAPVSPTMLPGTDAPAGTALPADLPDLGPVIRYAPPAFGSIEEILRQQRGRFEVVVVHGADLALRYGGLIRHLLPQARLLMNVNGLASALLEDRARAESRADLAQAARSLAICEGFATFMADTVITATERDAEILRGHGCATRIEIAAWPVTPRPRDLTFDQTHGIAMLGGSWSDPMLDAAEWLVGQVMPLVWARHGAPDADASADPGAHPGAHPGTHPGAIILHLPVPRSLAEMPARLQALARPGVVYPHNPDSLSPPDAIRLTVAPQRSPAGLQPGVAVSLANAVPCVMTPAATEGLMLGRALEGLVCDDARAMADAIVALYTDADRHGACVSEGLALIAGQFNAQDCDDAMARAARLPLTPSSEPALL